MAQITSSRAGGPFVIVVAGPECTGKSTLASDLAGRLDAPVSGEFARTYVDQQRAPLTAADVEPIARGQIAGEDEAQHKARHTVVKDTDLVSTVVYALHYYRACPAWIEQIARDRLGDLYLLLAPDVPWVEDGLQRDDPQHRAIVYDLFRRTLQAWNAQVVEIGGSWDERRSRARAAIASINGSGAAEQ
jgi:NadR type nicotinamide-nucleotide adenylyltransferase